MRLISFIFLGIGLSCFTGIAQSEIIGLRLPVIDSVAMHYAGTITESDLKNYLSILASDALEGRDTGSRGQKMAAAFIREHFKDNQLLPMVRNGSDSLYFQTLKLYKNFLAETYIEGAHKRFSHLNQIVYIGNAAVNNEEETKLQFVGNGEESDYQGLDIDGAMVAFIAKTTEERQKKIRIAREMRAGSYLVINTETEEEFKAYVDRNSHYFEASPITRDVVTPGNNTIFLTSYPVVAALFGEESQKLTQAVSKSERGVRNPFKKLNTNIKIKAHKISEAFDTENVLGLVEGSDKKDELIVITAHYDHVGKVGDQIFNGADDDASGTSAVMELAQAFARSKKAGHGPRRSLLFMTVTAEEKGLLGSEYYSNNPEWPLDRTIANLNIDMIGRGRPGA